MPNFVDLSNHQGGIDLAKIDSACFIFKATEGKGWRDSSMPGFVAQARKLGRPVGFYHFVSQNNTPEQEAQNFLDYTAAHRQPGDLLALDWEPIGTNPSPSNPDWARRWLDAVSAAARGAHPIWVYMNLSTANNGRWSGIADRWPLWVAHYPGSNTADGYNPDGTRGTVRDWAAIAAWQFTDGGKLPGWSGRLDINELYTPWWTDTTPKEPPVTIPPLRENDPAVDLVSSHGETLRSSNGAPRKACLCMALTFPLIEQEMIRRGLIKRTIDVYQAGYNAGKVAASAGTHDMGGVIDVAQGITLEQRKVWAEFGVMMFPRTRQYGWTTGDHGHGVWHGCPHQTASADQQVRSGIAGRDGLVSNLVRNFEAPKRTWQDAYRAATNSKPSPTRPPLEDDMPESKHHAQTLTPNGRDWAVTDAVVLPSDGPAKASARGTVTVPADVTVTTRWVSFHGKGGDGWWRDTVVTHSPGTAETTVIVDQASPADLRLDVKTDKPCEARVELTAQVWRK